MGEGSLGFVVEALVALLLAVTIGYCLVVNRKLERLRSDQSELKEIVRDLNAATSHAERAISGLQKSADRAEEMMGAHVASARDLSNRLSEGISQGEEVYSKLNLLNQMHVHNIPKSARSSRRRGHDLEASKIGLGLLNAANARSKGGNQDRGAA